MTNINIRRARTTDADLVVSFIKKLAAYEKLEGEAAPDVEAVRIQLNYNANPALNCLIAECNGQPAGFALYFFHYSTFRTNWGLYLEDFFVQEAFRGRGVGSTLFKKLGAIAAERQCSRFDLQVLDWNANAIDFYMARGGREITGWKTIRFEGDVLQRLAIS